MSSLKAFYGILLTGLILYCLLYSFLVRKLPSFPVVKIYFEEETSKTDVHLQQYFARETSVSLNPGVMLDGDRVSPVVQGLEISVKQEKTLAEITTEKEQGGEKRNMMMSFLEGLGIPVNKSLEFVHDTSTEAPLLVNPDGASLPELMKKIDENFNLEIGKPCPASHLNEVGLLKVDDNTVDLEEVEGQLSFVEKGGKWQPECEARKKVAIVVPFRDRDEHLYIFLRHMHQFLRWQMLEYRIFIVEQADSERFNRGMLMNVGFSEAMKADNFTCLILHDVDLIPEDARNDYGCPSSPRHMSTAVSQMDYKLVYKTLFGGVEGFWIEHYRQINGFPNRFWGWGGEDDDLYVRVKEKRLGFTRPAQMIGRYTMLGHSHQDEDKNPERFEELRRSEVYIDQDGLNTLTYNVLDYKEMPLYTLISAALR